MSVENWEGLPDASEHRTVGQRAWCYQDAEWCYPHALCYCCDVTRVPAHWKGMHAGEVLAELKAEIEAMRDSAAHARDVAARDGAGVLSIAAMSNVAAYERVIALFTDNKEEL